MAGIDLHTQLVVCPGINDGSVLTRSIVELGERHPRVKTIAVHKHVEMEDAGHMMHWTRPERLAEILRDFLAENT